MLAADLVARGELERARAMVETLDARVGKPGFQSLRQMLLNMPPADPEMAPFMDRPDEDVQIAPRPGARRAVFVFCGHAHRVGVPLNLLHRWLAPLGTHVVYLRDFRRLFYLAGIRSVAGAIDAVPVLVERVARQLGASDIAILGNSGGTYAALRTGLAASAEALIGIGGPNTFERIEDDIARRARLNGLEPQEILARAVPVPVDALLPPTRLLYADGNEADRWQAERLEFARNVELHPVEKWPHHAIVGRLAETGALARHLAWLGGGGGRGADGRPGAHSVGDHVPLHSPAGQAALQRAEGHSWATFEPLLVRQASRGLCGIASALTVLRAFDLAPDIAEAASDRPVLLAFLARIGAEDQLATALARGLSLNEVCRLLEAAGITSEPILAADTDLDGFRNAARAHLRAGGHVIVNFARRKLGQSGGGHFSPLVAYDPKSGSFLLADVAVAKWPPLWVKGKVLFSAMKRAGSRDDTPSRGFILIRAPDGSALTVNKSVEGA